MGREAVMMRAACAKLLCVCTLCLAAAATNGESTVKYGTEQRRFVPPMPMASLRAFLPPGTLNAPSGAIIQAGIIGLAVALFLYVVLTVFRNVDPVYYWLQSDVAEEKRPMRQALVSPIYPLMVLLVCTAVWGYYSNVCITQDWLNAAEAGSALDSARVHQRVGLQASTSLWEQRSAVTQWVGECVRSAGCALADAARSVLLKSREFVSARLSKADSDGSKKTE